MGQIGESYINIQFNISIHFICKECEVETASPKKCNSCGKRFYSVHDAQILDVNTAEIILDPVDHTVGPMA